MMKHDEANELLAPLALDALDADVRNDVEAHVEDCVQCTAELDGHREVAAALGNTFEPLPDDLWNRISSQLYAHEGRPTPPLALAGVGVTALRERRVTSQRQRRGRFMTALGSLAAAAAIVALSVNLASANNHASHLQNALSAGNEAAVANALRSPHHSVVKLMGGAKTDLAKLVLLRDGQGYLVSSSLPTLPSSETYQLWGIVNGKAVSLGVMGTSPKHDAFTVATSPAPTALAVSVEPSGGSVTPSKDVVASGAV